ncbi:hypothetical protein [Glycomyces arizonensis]|uniref:hypothetical protein n=1 Tax=Glycomyces arizonensis TaxID=256035 RepID=UPI000422A0D1|nr:hypothetical protein [Glycomyces arizonensis]
MTAVRSAPEEIRRSYHRALAALPLRATPPEVPDPAALTVLGGAVIDGWTVAFATRASRPRLWVCTGGEAPRTIGYLTGLVLGEPDLWVCDTDAWAWVNEGEVSAQLKAAATRLWHDCERTCDG